MLDKQRIKTATKLSEKGFDTEKKVLKIDMIAIRDNGLETELSNILDLQDAIRKHLVFSYFTNGRDTEIKEVKPYGTGTIND